MIELYSGVAFFGTSLVLAGLLLIARRAAVGITVAGVPLADRPRPAINIFAVTVCVMSIAISALVYGADYVKPLVFLGIMACVLRAYLIGWLSRRLSVILTIAPLVVAKASMLPILSMLGLSFATFRAIDVLLTSPQRQKFDWLEYLAYLFFPLTLLAGPMYRWRSFQKDLQGGFGRVTADNILSGWETILLGILQKYLFADLIDSQILPNIDAHDLSLTGIALNASVYSAFLYFDFAGYSNMAVGVGRMLGLELPRNFNSPILSRNPQDFWRRWHISLSEWLRDVVFMPVYMTLCKTRFFSRRRLFAQNIGVFLTLLGMGIWNGLSLHYIVSGILFGTYSVVFNIMVNRSSSVPVLRWSFGNGTVRFIGRVIGIVLAMLALYVFSGRSPL